MRAPIPKSSTPTSRPAERGSAYLFALLVLLLLTIIGLSLALTTQTEVQIGAAEKSATRVLYAGDAGVGIQLAMKQTLNNAPMARFTLDTKDFAGTTLTDVVDVSSIMVMYHFDCNLCTTNMGGNKYQIVNWVTNAQGRRFNIAGDTQSNKLISYMYLISPAPDPTADESLAIFDSSAVADNPSTPGLDVIRH